MNNAWDPLKLVNALLKKRKKKRKEEEEEEEEERKKTWNVKRKCNQHYPNIY